MNIKDISLKKIKPYLCYNNSIQNSICRVELKNIQGKAE